ncbi:hypothetical protein YASMINEVIRUS_985 [Yasminevirus sp. GU-2018]|uniref:Uncharacterized protein n=1 Tax=Yasminevirus sp. GU-2018 TaxID=2420051 RepID=A0A5K0UAJ8_9VIRU|nr:hypothetical protein YASMINEVIRUS_985 [Yasminevirus sp. GU-2018]
MDKKNFNYIIFHGGCLDGFSGFFVAHISGRLTKDVIIHEDVPSTTKIPPDIDGKDVVIIDVAYKKEVLEEIFKYAKSVVFIDHHVSIKEDVAELYKKYNNAPVVQDTDSDSEQSTSTSKISDNITIVYDDTRCGSTLAWSYFFGRQKIPLFLKYVEDQDTGHWIYPRTKPFIYALRSYYKLNTDTESLNRWFKLLNKENVAKLIKKGTYMKRYNDHIVSTNVPKHTLERFPSKKIYDMNPAIFSKPGQYKVAVYCGHNCPSVTELGVGALERMPEIDFCIMWVYNLDSKRYVLSMRSREVDISEICKIFNGGGHKLAAACSFSSSLMRIEDVFEGPSLPRTI